MKTNLQQAAKPINALSPSKIWLLTAIVALLLAIGFVGGMIVQKSIGNRLTPNLFPSASPNTTIPNQQPRLRQEQGTAPLNNQQTLPSGNRQLIPQTK